VSGGKFGKVGWYHSMWSVEPLPQTEILGTGTDREGKEDVINNLLSSLPQLGLGGSQKLVPHIQMSY